MARKPAIKKKTETSRYPKRDLSKKKVKTPSTGKKSAPKKTPSTGKKSAPKNVTQKKLPAQKTIKKKLVVKKKKQFWKKDSSFLYSHD
jgi:hypothetical protein